MLPAVLLTQNPFFFLRLDSAGITSEIEKLELQSQTRINITQTILHILCPLKNTSAALYQEQHHGYSLLSRMQLQHCKQ
jgi:hypothetical protein